MTDQVMEYAIFRRSDGENGVPVENLRYTTRAGAQEWLDLGYSNPEFWEVRGRAVGEWAK